MNKSVAHAVLTGSLAREFEGINHRKNHGAKAEFVRQAIREKIDRDVPRSGSNQKK